MAPYNRPSKNLIFMQIGRLCAEANTHLTTAQKRQLIEALPFGDTAFSKFAQIGADIRLYAPHIQRLLPVHYTTTYAVTLLTDEELKQAIADNVLHPDMTRAR
jgi:capsule polysaccharide modification protein KpsS